MAGETRALAEFAAGLRVECVPAAVMDRAAQLLLDTFGVAFGGHLHVVSNAVLRKALARMFPGGGMATIAGDPGGWVPVAAAIANAVLSHGMDFDDTHHVGLHPTAVLFPAAMAAAEMNDATGEQVLLGLVAGYEVGCRIARSVVAANHYGRGFHPTATVGTFAAAAAAGVVLGLSSAQMNHAFGLCGSQAAGSSQFLAGGGWNKHIHTGAAAMNGLMSATLAQEGFLGADAALEGVRGFLAGYTDGADPAVLVQGLGVLWETMEIGIKPYPCCRHSHAALDGLLALRAQHRIQAGEILSMRLGIPVAGVEAVGAPAEAKRRARQIVDGQFSLHFVAAVAMLTGGLRWEDYALAGKTETDGLCDRITVYPSSRAQILFPEALGAEIEIETARGAYRTFVDMPKGEPATFPANAELLAKFHSLADAVLGEGPAALLAERVLALAAEPRAGAVMRLARVPAHEPVSS